MTQYEWLDKLAEYVKREHGITRLEVRVFKDGSKEFIGSFGGGAYGKSMKQTDNFDLFKEQAYEFVNWMIKHNSRK